MLELADIIVLETMEEIHTGSSPVKGTNALVVKLVDTLPLRGNEQNVHVGSSPTRRT